MIEHPRKPTRLPRGPAPPAPPVGHSSIGLLLPNGDAIRKASIESIKLRPAGAVAGQNVRSSGVKIVTLSGDHSDIDAIDREEASKIRDRLVREWLDLRDLRDLRDRLFSGEVRRFCPRCECFSIGDATTVWCASCGDSLPADT